MAVTVATTPSDPGYAGLLAVSELAPVLFTLLDDDSWVARRSERVTFVSAGVVEHRLRVDFSLPDSAHNSKLGVYSLPLFAMPKRDSSWGFHLTDERGRNLAWPSRADLARLGEALLLRRAARVIKTAQLPAEVSDTLTSIAVSADPDEARHRLNEALTPAVSRPQAWLSLAADESFTRLASAVASCWIVVVVLSSLGPGPTVVELTYRRKLALQRSPAIRGALSGLGWRDFEVRIDVTQPIALEHRVDLAAPAGAELVGVHLHSGGEGEEAKRPGMYDAGSAAEASVELPRASREQGAQIDLRLRPAGAVVRPVIATGAIATAVTAAAVIWSSRIQESHSAAPTIVLLAAAAAVLGLVLVPSRNALVDRLMAPARFLLFVIGVATAAAAARVAVIPAGIATGPGPQLFLLITAVAAGIALALLVLTRPQRFGPTAVATPPGSLEPQASSAPSPKPPSVGAPRENDG